MKRILICGSNGLLGQRLCLMLGNQTEYEVLNTSHHRSFVLENQLFDYTQLDITHKSDVKSLISSFQPTVIFNAAAATNVDWCETHREEAWKINVNGVENLIEAARKVEAKLIHVSTDYIFDGKHSPYREDDRPEPLSYYGKSKLAAENALRTSEICYAIVRTIVVYGYGINVKRNFPLWVLENLRAGNSIRCAEDQVNNPTYVGDLARSLVKIMERDREGIYHVCGSEAASRLTFAHRVAEVFNLDASLIHSVKSSDLQLAARRPLQTSFVLEKAQRDLGIEPLDVRQGLTLLKQELEQSRRN
ncbi:MAG: dTDP-4-dehydrorhamnose reductase [Ignavibacteriae bacterium]|nr:dTDP-4-dehydrorhamnose reductase [Ignavibacteriota bacterium]